MTTEANERNKRGALQCVACNEWFYVVWNRPFETIKNVSFGFRTVKDGPSFCPFCGCDMDYQQAWEAKNGGRDEHASG